MRRRTSGTLGGAAALVAVALAAATALAATPVKGTFTGETAQTKAKAHAIGLRTNKDGDVVKITVEWRAKCDTPNDFWRETTVIKRTGVTNDGSGVFHVDGGHTSDGGGGIHGKVTDHLDGHFTDKRHAEGTWRAKVKVFNKKGNQIDSCSMHTTWQVASTD